MPVLDNARHERFAQEVAKGKSAAEAYQAAGYNADDKSAETAGPRLLRNVQVQARVDEILGRAAARVEIDRAWVLDRLVQNVERAMQVEEVKDPKGGGTGEFRYEGNVANKALELIGKELSMFKLQTELTGKDGAPLIPDITDEQRAKALAVFLAKNGVAPETPK